MLDELFPFDILADMHTHTVASKHAYSTLIENLTSAERNGMKLLAVTDHYFGNGDDIERKNEVARIAYLGKCVEGLNNPTNVRVIPGCEFNLGQEIYNRDKVMKNLKWKVIGLHTWFVNVEQISFESYYQLFENAARDGFTTFAHIEREMHRILYGFGQNHFDDCVEAMQRVVDLAVNSGIILEVNESSLRVNDGGAAERLRAWLAYAKSKNALICLGTDAHFCGEVGRFDNAIALLNQLEYPRDRILNCNKQLLREYA